MFGEDDTSILFSTSKLSRDQLNYLYNLADVQILLTSNEGWGLSSTEALLSGTPIVNNVTGGLQDQCRFEDENGEDDDDMDFISFVFFKDSLILIAQVLGSIQDISCFSLEMCF